MSLVVTIVSDLWKSFNMELLIFALTLTFAFAIRGTSGKQAGKKPTKNLGPEKSPKQVASAALEQPPVPRASPRTPTSGPPPRNLRFTGAERGLRNWGDVQPGAAAGAGPGAARRRHPGQLMDEVVDGMREHPGTRFASRALELYSELQEILKEDGMRMTEAARGSRHSPIDFYTTLVLCVMRVGKCHLVECLIDDMIQYGVSRPLVFYESAMKQLAGQKHYHLALSIYDRLVADGLEPSAVTCSCLISFAAEVGEFQRAAGFFEKLASLTTPSIRAYMTVLRVHGRRQDWAASLATFRDMQRRRVAIDSLVLNVILATGISADQIQGVEELLAEADGFQPPITDVVSYNTLVKGYAQHNDFDGAAQVIERMRKRGLTPNAITFNSVMDAAVRSHRSSEAWDLLKEMRRSGLHPDKYTCSIMVKGLAQSPSSALVQSALDLLREVDAMCDKTLRSTLYHSVIEAAAQAGETSLLMHAFSQMRQHKVVPTAAAYRRLHEFAEAHSVALGSAKAPVAAPTAEST
mmetsp:Transcript_45344/g.144547  ORF Transcript_45344/g.144547 Transcript_45344/m.144547 type:complete len:522 (-) Transcript_45344:104-1669(-)